MTEHVVIFRAWITRNGRRIYASSYGLRGFPIPVTDDTTAQQEKLALTQKGEPIPEKE